MCAHRVILVERRVPVNDGRTAPVAVPGYVGAVTPPANFTEWIETVGRIVDVVGVVVIAAGIGLVIVVAATRLVRHEDAVYGTFRQQLGRVILLGLELLVAADIIRTVAVTPTLESVTVLGVIVLVRTFLSFSLEVELTGSWPWQRDHAPARGDADPTA
jgi:uncharacterized membrane protein